MLFFDWVAMQIEPSEMFPRALQAKPKNSDIYTLWKQSLLHAYKFLPYCVSERLFQIVAWVVQKLSVPMRHTCDVRIEVYLVQIRTFLLFCSPFDGHGLSLTYLQVCGLNLPSLPIGRMPGTLRMWVLLLARSNPKIPFSHLAASATDAAGLPACATQEAIGLIAYMLLEQRIWD